MARRALIHDIEARERRGRWFPALAGLLTIALLASTWVGLFAFMGTTAAYGTFTDLERKYIPDVGSMDLTFPDLSQVSTVHAADGTVLAVLHDGRISDPTAYEDIPELVVYAVLAAEDEDYFEHEGVDFKAIASAALDNILYDTRRGGSTITQQIVKQNFVGDEITIERKIKEAFVSAEVERRFTKEQILEYYLNAVFFGSNAYGVAAAADEYFDKELDQLTLAEAATMAVLIRNPTLLNPRQRPADVLERRDEVIDNMLDQGWITQRQASAAKRAPLGVVPHEPFRGPADHVVAEVTRRLLDMTDTRWNFLGDTKPERTKAIFGCTADDSECQGGGGLRIETSIDLDMQLAANQILSTWFPLLPYDQNLAECKRIFPNDSEEYLAAYAETNSCAPTGAIATVDADTGAVVVMASGLPFDVEQFDLAVQGRRNPGSAAKPFALVTALEQGFSLKSRWSGASPRTLECPYVCSENGNTWTVANAGASYGNITLEQATYNSVNTVYAQVALKVGPENIVAMAHRMGITSPWQAVPSVALGSQAASPLEMASAYTNFATNGLWPEPYVISRILDSHGTVLYEHTPQRHQVGEPALFAAARQPLYKVPTSEGTAPQANIGRPQGGKTGTHQNYTDAWFVGFVPQYSTAVWTGYPTEQVPLRNVNINGQNYSRVFGGSVPAPIWAEFMNTFLADVPAEEFPELPEEDLEQYFEIPVTTVPWVVGKDAAAARAAIVAAGLYPWEVSIASLEPAGTVTGQSLAAGAQVEQGTVVYINVASGQTPTAVLPSLVGQTYDQAVAAIRQLENSTGVRVNVQRQNVKAPGIQKGVVVDMSPSANSTVGYGVLVTLFVSD